MTERVQQFHPKIEQLAEGGAAPPATASAPSPVAAILPRDPREISRRESAWLPALGRRRAKVSWPLVSFISGVLVPTLVFFAYLLCWAAPRYENEFRVAVRSASTTNMNELPSLLGLSSTTPLANDSNAVVQYLQSRDALEEIDKSTALREHYVQGSIDYWSRLERDAPIERFVRYWRKMLDAYYETTTGTIVVRISAFTPEMSLAAANAALSLSETLVNKMSLKARDDTLAFAVREVNQAEARLKDVNVRLTQLRDKESVLDVRAAAESTLEIASKLKNQIASLEANLATQSLTMNADAPSIVATRHTIAGLQEEFDKIKAEITASPNSKGPPLSSVVSDFSQVENDRVFAEKAYQSAMASLETARAEAARQQVYLATIVRPALPQEPSFPRPIRQSVTFFGIALATWAVVMLLVSAVRQRA